MQSDAPSDPVHQRHDTSYRFLLSSKKLFVELLRSFVHQGWVSSIDEANVQPIPHSFILQDFKRKEADLVYQVNLGGQEVVFYLLVEMQSRVDFLMPYRLLLYQIEIWRYLLKDKKKKETGKKSFRLPPIVPIVLYNGKRRWTASRQFRKLLSHEGLFGPALINFEYLLVDVVRYSEEDLLALSNTIGAVFMLDQAKDQEQLQERLGKLMHTIKHMPEESQQHFIAWIANVIGRKLPPNEPALQQLIDHVKGDASVMGLDKILDDIERKGKLEGKLEGKIEGRMEGEREAREAVAKQMLAEQLDTALIARVTGVPVDKIAQLREQLQ